jgi:Mitochondrial carrier protein
MVDSVRVKSSVVSGVVEVFATHPLDYAKTILQNSDRSKVSSSFQQFLTNPYRGVVTRLFGIVPMRILFWNSITYFKERGFDPVTAGSLTALVQTSVDYPIEQLKTQMMLHNKSCIRSAFKKPNLFTGYMYNLSRNMGFAIVLNLCIDGHDGSYYHGALGGFLGAIITHPLDSLKTWYQAGNHHYPSHWKLTHYWSGWHLRAGISLISMNIGWYVFSTLSKYLKDPDDTVTILPKSSGPSTLLPARQTH